MLFVNRWDCINFKDGAAQAYTYAGVSTYAALSLKFMFTLTCKCTLIQKDSV